MVDVFVFFLKVIMLDFKDEVDGVFKCSVVIGVEVDIKDVYIIGKWFGSVIVDF